LNLFVLLAGCSVTQVDSTEAIPVTQIACSDHPSIGDTESTSSVEPRPSIDGPLDPPRSPSDELFPLSLASFGSTTATSPAFPPPEENLFSIDYVKRVGRDMKHTFTAPAYWDTADWLTAGGVVAGVGAAFAFDKDIAKAVQRNRNATTDRIFNNIQPFGAEYSAGVLAAFYLDGELFHDPRAKSVALDGLSAALISGLITQPLKLVVGRNRPLAGHGPSRYVPFGGSYSFPSDHATRAFAIATVIAEHYDSPLVKIASYGLASAVGFARMNNNSHWMSDVVAGAAIGFFVGETVVHLNHNNLTLTPTFDRHQAGLQIGWSF
jgi:membrane-associated phospholipid phosphatase